MIMEININIAFKIDTIKKKLLKDYKLNLIIQMINYF